jgi:hypothetical protein
VPGPDGHVVRQPVEHLLQADVLGSRGSLGSGATDLPNEQVVPSHRDALFREVDEDVIVAVTGDVDCLEGQGT